MAKFKVGDKIRLKTSELEGPEKDYFSKHPELFGVLTVQAYFENKGLGLPATVTVLGHFTLYAERFELVPTTAEEMTDEQLATKYREYRKEMCPILHELYNRGYTVARVVDDVIFTKRVGPADVAVKIYKTVTAKLEI